MTLTILHSTSRRCIGIPLLATLAVLFTSGCAVTEGPVVITAEEFDAVQASGVEDEPPLRGAVERGAPSIIVDRPLGADVTAPVSVRLRFVPQDDAQIAIDTLRVKYGIFDVTKRVRRQMTVTPDGIEGEIETAKRGNYKLRVSISDDQDRTGRSTLAFRVVE